ncbi:hypothetical protein ABI_31670 [Asticcacaulis biprosthecium C19]|uniref:Transcription factor zinc-finger domain-containing protein n=1 Tax=Asticcacaulis biprosthecium C19 TaxID=715226 RepID=F4QRM6_9CAUL|nr:zf-TFIIB domain-containing protein [Asticcacaulis biprosthecium]EGF90152.1 hypothetical protein ABI_31670 [Asticcacaulis biprosthecium C19]
MPADIATMSCPVCKGSFREVLREGILIDVCTQCRGVWLDRGELEKLLSLARADFSDAPPQPTYAPPPQQTYQQPPQQQYRQPERQYRHDDDDNDKRKHYAQHGEHGYYDKHGQYRKKKKGFDFLDIFEFGD